MKFFLYSFMAYNLCFANVLRSNTNYPSNKPSTGFPSLQQTDYPSNKPSTGFPSLQQTNYPSNTPTTDRPTVDMGCQDYCVYSKDGECDDGGEGSGFPWCIYGSDCTDCGPRTITQRPITNFPTQL